MGDRLGTPGAVGFFLGHSFRILCLLFCPILFVSFSKPASSLRLPLFLLRSSRSAYFKGQNFSLLPCQRPYHVEHTSSRPNTEVKQHWARIVLGWETAWEHRVLLAFFCQSFRILCLLFCPILFVSVSKSALCTFLFFCYSRVGASTLRGKMFAFFLVNGHTMLNTPVLVRSLKSSNIGPGEYLDGRPLGNTRCCWLFFGPLIQNSLSSLLSYLVCFIFKAS